MRECSKDRCGARGGEWAGSTLALSPDGNLLAVCKDGTGDIQIFDLRPGKRHRLLVQENVDKRHAVACLAWSPDNRMLAVGGLDNAVRLWEIASGKVRRAFRGHEAHATCLAFSPDGKYLASGSEDTTILIWDVWGKPGAGAKLSLK